MAISFSRTMRSLSADNSRGALFAWSIASGLSIAWFAWFFFATVTIYQVSRTARLEVRRSVHPIATSIAGKVVSTRLRLGRKVVAREVLAELGAAGIWLRLAEEKARVKALPAQLQALAREMSALRQAGNQARASTQAAIEEARACRRLAARLVGDSHRRFN